MFSFHYRNFLEGRLFCCCCFFCFVVFLNSKCGSLHLNSEMISRISLWMLSSHCCVTICVCIIAYIRNTMEMLTIEAYANRFWSVGGSYFMTWKIEYLTFVEIQVFSPVNCTREEEEEKRPKIFWFCWFLFILMLIRSVVEIYTDKHVLEIVNMLMSTRTVLKL